MHRRKFFEAIGVGGALAVASQGAAAGQGVVAPASGDRELLPLGLPASDEFWSAPPQPWTSVKAWSGQPFPIDHAL